MPPSKADIALYRAFQKSPLLWIEKNFGLMPQPLKHGIKPDLPADQYTPEHFEPFEDGGHLTWQQWLFFRSVEWALAGKAARWISVRSGHGTGKSADVALLLLWFLFCFKDAQIPCTAPTSDQLKDILWKEIQLWLGRMKPEIRALYEWQDQYVRIVERPGTWFARARTGRKENPEALAGVHGKHILMLADEASGIHEAIFETMEGALTNKDIMVVLISNPTRLSGYFYETHNKNKRFWQCLHFSSQQSPIVATDYCQRWAEKYGVDSPQYAVRVLGEFPASEEDQFIPTDLFDAAASRTFPPNLDAPRILGVDVARFGDDGTELVERQAQLIKHLKQRHGQDTMATVGDIMNELKKGKAERNPYNVISVDDIGVGGGVTDRLRELQALGEIDDQVRIIGVNVSEKPLNDKEFINRRGELWQDYKDWLATGSVPASLKDDSCGIHYSFDSRGRLVMEKKEDMKDRGLASPGKADAACLTFAVKTPTRNSIKTNPYVKQSLKRKTNAWWAK